MGQDKNNQKRANFFRFNNTDVSISNPTPGKLCRTKVIKVIDEKFRFPTKSFLVSDESFLLWFNTCECRRRLPSTRGNALQRTIDWRRANLVHSVVLCFSANITYIKANNLQNIVNFWLERRKNTPNWELLREKWAEKQFASYFLVVSCLSLFVWHFRQPKRKAR